MHCVPSISAGPRRSCRAGPRQTPTGLEHDATTTETPTTSATTRQATALVPGPTSTSTALTSATACKLRLVRAQTRTAGRGAGQDIVSAMRARVLSTSYSGAVVTMVAGYTAEPHLGWCITLQQPVLDVGYRSSISKQSTSEKMDDAPREMPCAITASAQRAAKHSTVRATSVRNAGLVQHSRHEHNSYCRRTVAAVCSGATHSPAVRSTDPHSPPSSRRCLNPQPLLVQIEQTVEQATTRGKPGGLSRVTRVVIGFG